MLKKDCWLIWVFVAPGILLVAIFMYYPMVGTVIESLYTTSFINPTQQTQ